jgi:4-hydroxybenzoate polyprenyltransferase
MSSWAAVKASLGAYDKFLDLSAIQRWVSAAAVGILLALQAADSQQNTWVLTLGLIAISCILAYTMTVDDYFDAEIDKLNPRKKRILIDRIPLSHARVVVVALLLTGVIVSAFLSYYFEAVILGLVALSTSYTVPPIRYKRFYPFSTLGDGGVGFLPFLGGYVLVSPLQLTPLLVVIPIYLTNAYWRLEHEIRMIDFNRLTGKKTFPVVYGRHSAKQLRRAVLLSALLGTGVIIVFGQFSFLFKATLFAYEIVALFLPWRQVLRMNSVSRTAVDISWGWVFCLCALLIGIW